MENKQLQQAKDTIAKKYGYENYNMAIYGSSREKPMADMSKYVNEVAIEYHRLMSEWISVDERLPEPLKSILVFGNGIRSCAIYDKGNFYPDFKALSGVEVTHWMPLPQPPK